MKRYKILIVPIFALLFVFSSCEDFLNIPPEAAIDEDQVFGSYENFQNFQDQLPKFLVDYNRHGPRVNHSIGGECLADYNYTPAYGNSGNYKTLVQSLSIYNKGAGDFFSGGLYDQMWESVRLANVCLQQLENGYPFNASQEEVNKLRGQALFFRAYFHYEYVRAFGTIPYVDEVFAADKQNMNRHWSYEKDGKTYTDVQAVFERIVEDCEEAANLLPEVWEAPNLNWGRPTKVAALGFKAKALQYSASPLFNEQANGINDYDKDLLDRCAVACQDVIDLAIKNIGTQPEGMNAVNADGLSDWADYRTVFATIEGIQPGTPEVLFKRPVDRYGNPIVSQSKARVYMIKQLSNQTGSNGTQSYLDKWEMADGSRYKLEYDQDPVNRWDNRDPRFRFTFYVHGDQVHTHVCNFSTPMIAGDFNSNAIRKFMCDNVKKGNTLDATYSTPLLRLADIYLTYAEAVFESTGSYTDIPAGLKLSAASAVDKVRARASMPNVAATIANYEANPLPGSCELETDPAFRVLYRNERAVELAYEGVYWFDIRRWKVAHHKDGLQLQAMHFDVDDDKNVIESSVKRVDQAPFVFKDANYWMPFLDDMIFFTSDWEQNPGW